MSYALSHEGARKRESSLAALKPLLPLVAAERRGIIVACCAMIATSASALAGPLIIARAVDAYIAHGIFAGVIKSAGVLLVIYLCGFATNYVQTRLMGEVGRRVLFKVRSALFEKLQELPVAFFNQNRSGDLVSRINNDTEKLFQFIAHALTQFVSNGFLIFGAGIMLVALNPALGLSALAPAAGVLVVTRSLSGWVRRRTVEGLRTLGGVSGEAQESLANFKVIEAFNRADYFERNFRAANESNFKASLHAGIASAVFPPLYGLAYNLGQLVVLGFGIWLTARGAITTGLLIGYLLYVNNVYQPLSQLGAVWSSLQLALAALDRISELLGLESNLVRVPAGQTSSKAIMEFRCVSFGYIQAKQVLHRIDLMLERGKTYALVGPTGGGKSTMACLMARLYDPLDGCVLFGGRDIRSYSAADRAARIGFIPQEPFVFAGTVGDNIVYGNTEYRDHSSEALAVALDDLGLAVLLTRFEAGLDTAVAADGDSISLGQKQLIAFMRAVLRRPELLILDEATANIDTVTEQLLESILAQLPGRTTKVIVAHRLNTIKRADEIFFVNAGEVIRAGSMEHAMGMLWHGKATS